MASFLIQNVRIFDGEHTIEKGAVLVENGKISKVSADATGIAHSGTTYSRPGYTLLPGLIDTHIHADGANRTALPQALRLGVTTVCDMHNEWHNILKLRKQREGGDCADLKTTSFAATVDMGWPMPIMLMNNDTPDVMREIASWPKLKTPEDGRQYVQDRLKEGVDYIKLMHESGTVIGRQFNIPSIELQRAIIEEAHRHGIIVVAHATCLADTIAILEAGVDGLTHTFIDQPPTQELIDLYKRNGAHLNPTLVTAGSKTTEGKALQEKFAHDPRVQDLITKTEKEQMCKCMSFAKGRGYTAETAFESVRQLKKAGVPIIVGSDSAGPALGTAYGLSTHHEIHLFVNQCGFTPKEALVAATSLPAKRFKFSDRGYIREGLRADLTLVEGNPLEDIDHTLNLRGVWVEGQLCSAYRDNF